jgi:hypothetical protein
LELINCSFDVCQTVWHGRGTVGIWKVGHTVQYVTSIRGRFPQLWIEVAESNANYEDTFAAPLSMVD